MKNNIKYNRKTIRLKGYDYSKEGLYFITITIKNKLCLFGKIKNNKNILFDPGKMIEKKWLDLKNKFKNISLHEYIIMPNHFHGIIEIKYPHPHFYSNPRRGEPCVRPDNITNNDNCPNNLINSNNNLMNPCNQWMNTRFTPTGGKFLYNKNSLSGIMQYFKSKTTNEYIKCVKNNKWLPFNGKLWQRNFYEHIIRNDESYDKIKKYIKNNPIKWKEDKFYIYEI